MATAHGVESTYAWWRLLASLLLSAIGGVGLWSAIVVLPAVQSEFGVARAGASLPYTATMLGFAIGGVLMGRLGDRRGVVFPVIVGALMLSLGYVASAFAASLWQFAAVQGVLIGALGSSATFGPLVADVSHWFTRNRGIAVGICASGNYLAGTVWPPIIQHLVDAAGWRQTHVWIGLFCAATMLPLGLALRRQTPVSHEAPAHPLAPTAAPVARSTSVRSCGGRCVLVRVRIDSAPPRSTAARRGCCLAAARQASPSRTKATGSSSGRSRASRRLSRW